MTMQSLINIDGNGLKDVLIDLNDKPVSYTHLTLPTIA